MERSCLTPAGAGQGPKRHAGCEVGLKQAHDQRAAQAESDDQQLNSGYDTSVSRRGARPTGRPDFVTKQIVEAGTEPDHFDPAADMAMGQAGCTQFPDGAVTRVQFQKPAANAQLPSEMKRLVRFHDSQLRDCPRARCVEYAPRHVSTARKPGQYGSKFGDPVDNHLIYVNVLGSDQHQNAKHVRHGSNPMVVNF